MVTVETAMVLPLLLLFALFAVAVVGVAQARLRCADTAREAARAAARGQPGSTSGPVEITVERHGQTETAVARVELRPLDWLPAITVVESATAAVEPSTGAPR